MKKLFKAVLKLLLLLLLAFAALLAYLTFTEFDPAPREEIAVQFMKEDAAALFGDTVRILTLNTGYAGLGSEADFFMDGGKETRATDKDGVAENLRAMTALIMETDADFTLLQEVDQNSTRSYGIDQQIAYPAETGLASAFALNYNCDFVPIPFPPLGRIESGIQTLTPHAVTAAERVSLPCAFEWPVSTAQMKRCLLITRTPIEGSDKELVVINFHFEAYDNGEGKVAQTRAALAVLEEEYEKGNYVIAGGDFNQAFPGTLETYPVADPETWMPGILEQSQLPVDWQFVFDPTVPTCRLLDAPYDAQTSQHYIIDGFIVSPNVEVCSVSAADLGFVNSDHNPVLLEAKLK